MSTGLMSCVRENSPPLEMAAAAESTRPASLSPSFSSLEQTKRRRFHPLRNLRRIFRRRTLTNAIVNGNNDTSSNTTQSNTTTPTHNSPSVLLERTIPNLTLSSPSSPANATISQYISTKANTSLSYNTSQQQLQEQSQEQQILSHLLPTQSIISSIRDQKSSSNSLIDSQTNIGISENSLYGGVNISQSFPLNFSPSAEVFQQHVTPTSSINLSIAPDQCDNRIIINKLPTILNSSNQNSNNNKKESFGDLNKSVINETNLKRDCEISDNQRSFSEDRLIDSEFVQDTLSQSHDSVFLELAATTGLSVGIRNELFDALRKRRNRTVISDDFELSKNPAASQSKNFRETETTDNSVVNFKNLSGISSFSHASPEISDIDDEIASNFIDSVSTDRTNSNNVSSSTKILQSTETLASTSDDLDLNSIEGVFVERLSHSAARHKMAVRPKKNKGPTRNRQIELTHLSFTPEINEDFMLTSISTDRKDLSKEKSRSLPYGATPKIINQQNDFSTDIIISNNEESIKRSKTEKGLLQSNSYYFRHITRNSTSDKDLNATRPQSDSGFFKRLLNRGSKDDTKLLESNVTEGLKQEEVAFEYSKQVEHTRNEIRREIMNEANSGLSLMLNNFILSKSDNNNIAEEKLFSDSSKLLVASNKPKSGPAARQRIMPKDLSVSRNSCFESSSEVLEPHYKNIYQDHEEGPKTNSKHRFSDNSNTNKNCMEISNEEMDANDPENYVKHTYSKNSHSYPQNLHQSQKFLDSQESPKQRKAVEKSKSFRIYNGSYNFEANSSLQKSENMPSLPDLTFSRNSFEDIQHAEEASISLGFEINDNNLIKTNSRSSITQEDTSCPLRQGIYTKNIILTTVSPKPSKNISEIEDSIDKILIKSSHLILNKCSNTNDNMNNSQNVVVTHVCRNDISDSQLGTTTPPVNKFRTESVKPINIFDSTNNPLIKENHKSLVEISKDNDINSLGTTICSSLISTSLEYKNINESLLRLAKLQEIEKRKSVDLQEIKKVFTSKHETSEKIISNSGPSIKEEIKEIVRTTDTDSNCTVKYTRNQLVSEKLTNDIGVPEFMKIQLNKVTEPCRPKTNLVLSKIIKPSVETENQQSSLPHDLSVTDSRITSLDKTQSETKQQFSPPRSNELEKKNNNNLSNKSTSLIKKSFDEGEVVILRNHPKSQNLSQKSPKYERRNSVNDEKLKYEKKLEKMQKTEKYSLIEIRKPSFDNDINSNNTTSNTSLESMPSSILMRKKSLSLGNQIENNKDDSTPELMKVFARRSLKIKDEDIQTFVEESSSELKNKCIKSVFINNNSVGNLDSDKENQSSSEEKLNKLTKLEPLNSVNQNNSQKLINSSYGQKMLTIQHENNEKHNNSINSNCSNSSNVANCSSNMLINSNLSNTNNNSPIKAFNRNNNNINNLNKVTNVVVGSNRNSLTTIMSSINDNNSNNKNNINSNNNNNNNHKNNNNNNNNSNNNDSKNNNNINNNKINNDNKNNNNNNSSNNNNNHISDTNGINLIYTKKQNVHHTVGSTTTSIKNNINSNLEQLKQITTTTISSPKISNMLKTDEVEFKGILQRRAEWEKRVKEAAK